jgi:CDP-diacylglycerol--glycerol-3-phosphate 3-phosphatidyltransferase
MKATKYLANFITFIRIICSFLLLLFSPFSPSFYTLYLIAGFSDMIDGTVARKTNSVSEFGSKLDTIADLFLVTVSLIKIIPVIIIPPWLFTWIILIAFIKMFHILIGFLIYKKFISVHSTLNKITGFLLFVLPLTLSIVEFKYSATFVCIIASIAAIMEFFTVDKKNIY